MRQSLAPRARPTGPIPFRCRKKDPGGSHFAPAAVGRQRRMGVHAAAERRSDSDVGVSCMQSTGAPPTCVPRIPRAPRALAARNFGTGVAVPASLPTLDVRRPADLNNSPTSCLKKPAVGRCWTISNTERSRCSFLWCRASIDTASPQPQEAPPQTYRYHPVDPLAMTGVYRFTLLVAFHNRTHPILDAE